MSDILNQVISIAQLIENNDDGDCFNETLVHRPKQCYCDDEIHGITLQFRRLDTLCKSDDESTVIESYKNSFKTFICHKIDRTNTYVFYFVIGDIDVIGIIEDKNFTFVGTSGSHPFISTNNFIYDNSDGSGPWIQEYLNGDYSYTNLYTACTKYYDEFIHDQHH